MGKSSKSTFLNNRLAGLLSVFLLSIILVIIFYGTLILKLNKTYFSTDGDGIQSYYNTYYLAKYDSSLMYSYSMNYPYGEVSFYTLSQPLVAGTIKFVSQNLIDITDYTVGILNFLMLFSLVLASVFLYLLLTELALPPYLAVFIAAGIAFLSPQIDRFPGHYTLSYVFAIPLLLYLLLLFHRKKPKIMLSVITGAVLFVLMTCHVYYVAFFSIAILFYWLFAAFSRNRGNPVSFPRAALYITLQLIIPVAIFYLITSHYSHLTPDRPSRPFGFLVYKASPESVLLPLGVDYGRFLHKIRNFDYVQWEGVSYVGITAAAGFFLMLAALIKKILKRNWKGLLQVTDNYFLNVIFWASFAALLYSFGVPFIFGLDFLVEYLGPLQQMRAIGRFAWLFYFVINIVVFYKLWHIQKTPGKRYLRTIILVVCIVFLYTDVYYFLKYRQGYLNNKFSSWSDVKNAEPDDKWVRHIEAGKYQAILPVPFYHMGSDNYGIDVRCNMLAYSFLVSMKTGLPISAIYMSRASISQSIKNIALVLEPYRQFKILKDFPDRKPFLIVAARCNEFTPQEKNLIRMGMRIDSTKSFDLYQLDFDSLGVIPLRKSQEIGNEFASQGFIGHDSLYKSVSDAPVESVSFNNNGQEGYQGKGLQIKGRSSAILFDDMVSSPGDSIHTISFWISPIDRDLFPKTRLEIELFNEQGIRYGYKNEMAGGFLKTVDDSWGLIEYRVQFSGSASRVKIAVYNTQIKKRASYRIDELLIRPDNCNVYCLNGKYLTKNNRWYHAR